MLNKGDEVNVRVVEVDRERGRIGLRLADDPEIAGKSIEELAASAPAAAAAAAAAARRRADAAAARTGAARAGGERGSGRRAAADRD